MEEDKTKNLPMDEEENQDSLVDYDSDSSVVTVVERERGSDKTINKDEEEKENKKETEAKGAIPKRGKPKIIENIYVNREWAENRPVLPIGTKMLYEKQEKMVDKMESVVKMLDKVMTQATSMMENMVEVAHVNLEKEKLKIRRLEIKKKIRRTQIARTKGGSMRSWALNERCAPALLEGSSRVARASGRHVYVRSLSALRSSRSCAEELVVS
ncbi:uncharacterized protein [Temnothorax longispinosus]|uniref:uncharacterized protein isoform X2 n=1 Tax=Temnothorax longispinosus TaxID=300112 RepID=UPI003A9A5AEC